MRAVSEAELEDVGPARTSRRSACGKIDSSRLADAVDAITPSPWRISTPPSSTVFGCEVRDLRARAERDEAHQFLDRVRDELGTGAEDLQLLRIVEQAEHELAQLVGGGLVAGHEDGHGQRHQLAFGDDRVVFVARGHQRAEDVVGRFDAATLDQTGEVPLS